MKLIRKSNYVQALLMAWLFFPAPQNSPAATVTWFEISGESGPVGGLVSATLVFDDTGSWTAYWQSTAANPFAGYLRFNLNLFDTALGDVNTASSPQVSLDDIYDFGSSSATSFSYSGNTAFLANWNIGDLVSTGNSSNFTSGVVSINHPNLRDNLLATDVITAEAPEPATPTLLLFGLTLMALQLRVGRFTPHHHALNSLF